MNASRTVHWTKKEFDQTSDLGWLWNDAKVGIEKQFRGRNVEVSNIDNDEGRDHWVINSTDAKT
jgi:dTDP-4-dehydrorhamnose 3,5-epimerase-like enzyme